MKKCTNPKCGSAPVDDLKKFCNLCGSPLEPIHEVNTLPQAAAPVPQAAAPVQGRGGSKALVAALVFIILILSSVIAFIFIKPMLFDSPEDAENVVVSEDAKTTERNRSGSLAAEEPEAPPEAPPEEPPEEKPPQLLFPEIVQVDSGNFPKVSLYINILDEEGTIPAGLGFEDFEIHEIDETGKTVPANIEEMRQILVSDSVSVNLVLDISGSMSEDNKMEQAQYAASMFLSQLGGSKNDLVEITAFDDYVYVPISFTDDYSAITNNIYDLRPGGQTALNDAIYAALLKTNTQPGAKCVIVFTDGLENRSSYTYDDVVFLAHATGIPLYIIGIGRECDEAGLTRLAETTNGMYYSAETSNLGEVLARIYSDIYTMQREWYFLEYTSNNPDNTQIARRIKFASKSGSPYSAETAREYIPEPVINQSFADKYKNKDYILDFTSSRPVTQADLSGLSLAELRIARNEIFARHGRQFKDPLLNKWFYSKPWYLGIMIKYSPADFDKGPTPLSKLEQDNTAAILEYEQYIMEHERIFPQSNTVRLTEYDVSLLKAVLTRGLEEIYTHAGVSQGDKSRLNDVEKYNVEMIEGALNQADIVY